MKVTILGCGRVGSILANFMDQQKHEVVIVDSNSNTFESLSEGFSGTQVVGNITDEDILNTARIGDADVIVILTSDDIANLMAAQIAKQKFGKEKIVVRVRDPIKAGAYKELGLDTICPTNIEFDMLMKELKIKPMKAKGGG